MIPCLTRDLGRGGRVIHATGGDTGEQRDHGERDPRGHPGAARCRSRCGHRCPRGLSAHARRLRRGRRLLRDLRLSHLRRCCSARSWSPATSRSASSGHAGPGASCRRRPWSRLHRLALADGDELPGRPPGHRRRHLGVRLRRQRPLRPAGRQLLRHGHRPLAVPALLVAGGRGAVLPRLAAGPVRGPRADQDVQPAASRSGSPAARSWCCSSWSSPPRSPGRSTRPSPRRPPPTSRPSPGPGSSASVRWSRSSPRPPSAS